MKKSKKNLSVIGSSNTATHTTANIIGTAKNMKNRIGSVAVTMTPTKKKYPVGKLRNDY